MSMDKLKDLFYKELPAQNKAFVEGGVLVHPQMFNIVLPTEMSDDDLYQYMSRYVTVLDPLTKAQTGEEGKLLTKEAALKLGVDPDEFMKNSSLLYQLECVLAGEMLPATFDHIKKVYDNQVRRARIIMIDLSGIVSPQTVQRTEQINHQLMVKQLPPPKDAVPPPTHQQPLPPHPVHPTPPQQQFLPTHNPIVPTYSGAENNTEPRNFKSKLTGVLTSTPALFTYALIGGYAIYSSLVVEEEPDEEYIE